MHKSIKIRGARVNNLKSVDLDLPLNKLVCFFGPSGSGKTSIAFHTLFSESKRRFLNSFPTYLKFFSDRPSPVDVDEIYPVLPVFGLPQNNPVVGTRANAADTMHLTELFQNLFYYYATELCPLHKKPFVSESLEVYLTNFLSVRKECEVISFFVKGDDFVEYFKDSPFPSRSIKSKRAKKIIDFDQSHEFWEVARFKSNKFSKINEKLDAYIKQNLELFVHTGDKLDVFSFIAGEMKCSKERCEHTSHKDKNLSSFSPYNPLGACSECSGFGEVLEFDVEKLYDPDRSVADGGVQLLRYKRFAGQLDELKKQMKKNKIALTKPIKNLQQDFFELLYEGAGHYRGFNAYFKYLERKRYKMNVRIFIRNIQKSTKCPTCLGSRMKPFSQQFYLDSKGTYSLYDLLTLEIAQLEKIFSELKTKKNNLNKEATRSLRKIQDLLDTACGIGLGHLQISRKAKSLSAGEYQRLLLLKYLAYDGRDSLFVFDEPSLGLSENENQSLLKGFEKLLAQGNSVVLIEHSLFFRKKSDYLVEMGPGAGNKGGEILYAGLREKYKFKTIKNSLQPIQLKKREWINVTAPTYFGKTFADFKVPIGEVTWVNGPSGSGKTASLINVLATKLYYDIHSEHLNIKRGSAKKIHYNFSFDDVIVVDANLNRYTSRSTVGSLTGLFTMVRKHFLATSAAKVLGLKEGHLSYNSDLGQCPKCEGKGVTIVEMQFLEDIVLTCEDCLGKKLKPIYANITDGAQTVNEAYSEPLDKILNRIKLTPKFQRIFEYIKILNLDYLSLNRTIKSLSGGEKQRIYLLSKLQKDISSSILFFENLSFGLSEVELVKLCEFIQSLTLKNNTVVLIDQDEIFKNIGSHHLKITNQ